MDSPRLARSSISTIEEVRKRERIPPYVRTGIYPPRPYQLSPYYYRNIFAWFIPFFVLTILIASISRMKGFSYHSESSTLEHGLGDMKQMSTLPISDIGNHLPSTDRFPHHITNSQWTDINEYHLGWFDWLKGWFSSRPSEAEILHAKETFEKVDLEESSPVQRESNIQREINKAKATFEKIEDVFYPYVGAVHTAELVDTTEIRRESDGIHIVRTYVREVVLSSDQFEKDKDQYEKVKEKIKEETEKVKHKAEELGSKVEEKVEEASESMKEGLKEKAEDFGELVKETIINGSEKIKETSQEIKDSVKEKISEVKERVEQGAEKVKEKVIEGSEIVREKVEEGSELLKEKLIEGRDIVKEKISEGAEKVKEKVIEGSDIVREKAEEVGERIKEKVIQEGEKIYDQAEDLTERIKDKVNEMKENTKEDLWYVSEALKQRARVLFADWDIQEKVDQWKEEEERLRKTPHVKLPPSSTKRAPSGRPFPTMPSTPGFTFSDSKPLTKEQIEYYQRIMNVHLPEHSQPSHTSMREKLHEDYEDAKNRVEDFGVKMRVEDRWEHVKDAGKVLSHEARNKFEQVEKTGERVKETVEDKVYEAYQSAKNLGEQAKYRLGEELHQGYERAKDASEDLKNKAEDFGESVKMRVEDQWEHVKDTGKELNEKIHQVEGKLCDGYCEEKFHQSKDNTGHEFEDSVKSTWDGIKDVFDKVKDVSQRGYERAVDRSQRDKFGNKIVY